MDEDDQHIKLRHVDRNNKLVEVKALHEVFSL